MEGYESRLFGTLQCPNNFYELIDLICVPPKKPHSSRVWIWRGQGDIDWPVHSTAYRLLASRRRSVTEADISHYEGSLLERATHRGFRLHNGHEMADFELLARLRHHGAATRLIDATRNALVALWFCVADRRDKTGLLLGVNSDTLGGHEERLERRPYSVVVERLPDTHPMTWDPPQVTPRVAAQHSQFLFSPIVQHDAGTLAVSNDEDVRICIAISPEFKATCIDILAASFDIRRITLFPDLDGFCAANGVVYDTYGSYRW